MKKLFIISYILVALVVLGNAGFYLYQKNFSKPESKTVSKVEVSQEEKEISLLDEDINGLSDFDLSEVDSIEKDLSEVDLSGI